MAIENDERDHVQLTEDMTMQKLAYLPDLSMDILTIEPGATRTPVSHIECSEILYILDGQLDVFVGSVWHRLSKGDSVAIPPGASHGSVNRSEREVRMIAVNSPAFDPSFERELDEPLPMDPLDG